MDTNRTHRSPAMCLAHPSPQPMKEMVTCTMPGIVMPLAVPFSFTRCDVKESVLGRVFQRYSRGQDVRVLPLADVQMTVPQYFSVFYIYIYIYIYILLTSSIPFQLSPVPILNNVSIAVPKSMKRACGPRPWQDCDGEHSATNDQIRQLTYIHTHIPVEFKLKIAIIL